MHWMNGNFLYRYVYPGCQKTDRPEGCFKRFVSGQQSVKNDKLLRHPYLGKEAVQKKTE